VEAAGKRGRRERLAGDTGREIRTVTWVGSGDQELGM